MNYKDLAVTAIDFELNASWSAQVMLHISMCHACIKRTCCCRGMAALP